MCTRKKKQIEVKNSSVSSIFESKSFIGKINTQPQCHLFHDCVCLYLSHKTNYLLLYMYVVSFTQVFHSQVTYILFIFPKITTSLIPVKRTFSLLCVVLYFSLSSHFNLVVFFFCIHLNIFPIYFNPQSYC